MISSVDSQSSGLTQLFFQNRFPEQKDEPLFSLENSKKSADGSSTSASRQQSGMGQAGFAQAMQHAARTQNAPKEEHNAREQSSQTRHMGQNEAYEQLKIKAQYNALLWT